jgi:hypothetical protein
MRTLRSFLAFAYDFVVGDDPTVAAGIVIALALTAALTATGVPAWWLMPLALLAILTWSLHRAIRRPED